MVNNDNDSTNSNGSDDTEIESINGENSSSGQNVSAAQLKELTAQNEKLQRDFLYLRADFDNYKKSVIKERSDIIKYGSERVFTELLDVLDNFDRALDVKLTPETIENFKAGIKLTATELRKVMQKFGIQEIECAGLPFDPNLHEALSSEETTEMPAGHITRVFRKAYKLHDRVIRPAQVVVAKEPKNPQ